MKRKAHKEQIQNICIAARKLEYHVNDQTKRINYDNR